MLKQSKDQVFKVTLINPQGLQVTIDVPGDEYILDAVEQQDIEFPLLVAQVLVLCVQVK